MKPQIAFPDPCSYNPKYSQKVLPDYRAAIGENGGELVLIESRMPLDEIMERMASCSALLLPSCSADVDPQKYGRPPHPKAAKPDPLRATLDDILLRDAYKTRKPILGVCYGLQSLNVWHGGTLYQDLESERDTTLHKGKDEKDLHGVTVELDTRLAHVLRLGKGNNQIKVNSKHRQAARKVPDKLRIAATAEDGVIEALEGTDPRHHVLAVQWHPERDFRENDHSRNLLKHFIEEAKGYVPVPTATRLHDFANRLSDLLRNLRDEDAITDTLDYVLGALYGLDRAHELGFRDRTMPHGDNYRPHLANYAIGISRNETLNTFWMAGFYFNSAIQRIAAAFDRIPRMLGVKVVKRESTQDRMKKIAAPASFANWLNVHKEVNRLKHPSEGLAAGRKVTMDRALAAFEELISLLETKKSELMNRAQITSSKSSKIVP